MGKGGDNSSGPTAAKVLNDGAETSGAVAGQERAPLLVTREEMKKQHELSDCTFQPRTGRRPEGVVVSANGTMEKHTDRSLDP